MKVGAYVTVGSGSGTVEAARDDCGDCDINEGNRSHDGYGDAGTARVGAGSSSLAEVMAIGSAASTGRTTSLKIPQKRTLLADLEPDF